MNLYKDLPHTNGYIHSSNIKGNRNAFNLLKKLLEKGEVEKLRSGLYKIPEIASLNHYQEVSLMYPNAIFCLDSAADFHQISNHVPPTIHFAIGQKSKMKLADYPRIQLYYWTDKMISQHQTNIDGVFVFTIERTVCDIIRYYRNRDVELVKDVVRSYLKLKNRNFDLLFRTAENIGVKEKVRSVFELML
jgi:hypothetical protein